MKLPEELLEELLEVLPEGFPDRKQPHAVVANCNWAEFKVVLYQLLPSFFERDETLYVIVNSGHKLPLHNLTIGLGKRQFDLPGIVCWWEMQLPSGQAVKDDVPTVTNGERHDGYSNDSRNGVER